MTPVSEPHPVLDPTRCQANLARMTDKCRRLGLTLAPHLKTPRNPLVGSWLQEAGIRSGSVSSLSMARHYWGMGGWDHLTLAILPHPELVETWRGLSDPPRLHWVVDHPMHVRVLSRLDGAVKVWLKVDTGAGRTGLNTFEALRDLGRSAARRFQVQGLLSHGGQNYHAAGPAQIRREASRQNALMVRWAHDLGHDLGQTLKVSVGDTPSALAQSRFPGVDELRCGNFLYLDLMQVRLGVCRTRDLALAWKAPIIGVYPERRSLTLHVGSIHLSQAGLPAGAGEPAHFGRIAHPTPQGWGPAIPGAWITRLSQEHSVVEVERWSPRYRPGAWLCVLPVHSCLATPSGGVLQLAGGGETRNFAC